MLVPYSLAKRPEEIVDDIESAIKHSETFITFVGDVRIAIKNDGVWSVKR